MHFSYEFKENESSRLFRPLAFDSGNDLFLCDDKTVAFSFICQPASGWDTNMLSTVELMLSQDAYPTDSLLSFTLWSSPDIRAHLKASHMLRHGGDNELFTEIHNASLGFTWSGTKKPIEVIQNTKVKNFQLIVTFKMPIAQMAITEEEMDRVLAIQRVMFQRLQKAYLSPSKMTQLDYMSLMDSILHWEESDDWRHSLDNQVHEDRTLAEQVLQPGTSIFKKRHGVDIGNEQKKTYVRMMTAKKFPRKARTGQAFRWFGDPFDGLGCVTQNFMITINIQYPNSTDSKSSLKKKHSLYIKQGFSALTHFAPKIKEMKADLDEICKSIEKDGKPVKVSVTTAVFGDTELEADEGQTALQSFMRQSGMVMVNEDSFSIPSFIQLLPFGADNDAVNYSRRYFTLSTKHVMPVLPIFSEWKGTGTPMLQFVSRTGQLMNFDLYDSKTNYNCLIYAESGAGKSFLTNEIIRAYTSTGGIVWTVDAGESYKKLSSSFDGNFITVNSQANLSFNPFTMIPEGDREAFIDSLEMLAGCVLAMAFTKDSPSDLQASEIERILIEVWDEKGQSALIDDVKAKCLEDEDVNIRNIGKQLTAFTTKGQFGKYFDKPHNVEFNGNFNVLELDGLSETPRLQAVVLFMLMVQISHSMYVDYKRDRSIKRIVIIDEAWDLLGNSKAVTEFMEKGFRRFRKYEGSGIIVTQSIMDLQTSEAGKAIAANAANSLILKQKDSTISVAEKENLMSLPRAGYRLLKKVDTEIGHYSEIFFNTNAGMGIGRLIVDPARMLMYSTRARDNKAIDDYTEKNHSLSSALMNVASDRGLLRLNLDLPSFLSTPATQTAYNYDADILEMPMTANVEVKTESSPELKVVNK